MTKKANKIDFLLAFLFGCSEFKKQVLLPISWEKKDFPLNPRILDLLNPSIISNSFGDDPKNITVQMANIEESNLRPFLQKISTIKYLT